MRTVLLAAFSATMMTASAHAVTINTVGDLGTDPTSASGAFFHSLGTLNGSFNDAFTFNLDRTESLTIASLTNVFPNPTKDFITGFTAGVFAGTPTSPGMEVLGPDTATLGCGKIKLCQSIAGTAILASGTYFLDITGSAGGHSGYGGNLATVAVTPLPAALPMFAAGFLLGWFGLRRRRHDD